MSLFLIFCIFWILGHWHFPIRHGIKYFAGNFSGCDLGFCHVVALLTWSNCFFDPQVEKKQCKKDTSCSCTHASLASRLKSRQRMAKYIQASSMPPRLKAKILVRSCLSLVIFLVARGIEWLWCLIAGTLELFGGGLWSSMFINRCLFLLWQEIWMCLLLFQINVNLTWQVWSWKWQGLSRMVLSKVGKVRRLRMLSGNPHWNPISFLAKILCRLLPRWALVSWLL